MNTSIKRVHVLFFIDYWLICSIVLVLIITSLSFFAGIGIDPWLLPISFVQVWYIPVIILVTLEIFNKNKFKTVRIVLYSCLILNISFTLIGTAFNFLMSKTTDYQMEYLKASKKPIKVQWNTFNINRVCFEKHNIPYIESDLNKEDKKENIIRSSATFLISEPLGIHKLIFVRWSMKL